MLSMMDRVIFILEEQWHRDSLPEAAAAALAYRDFGLETDVFVAGPEEEAGGVPAPAYGTLYMADSERLLRQLADRGAAFCAYSHSGNAEENLRGADYILMEPQWVDRDSLVKIWQRQRNLPWTILETGRCTVREFTPGDLEAIYLLYDDEARRFLEPPSEDRAREREILASYVEKVYRLCGYGHWAVLCRETGELIGRMGFSFPRPSDPGPVPDASFGYLIRQDRRGRGIAREVCGAILDYGFSQLGFESVGADAAILNVNSIKILEYFGFTAVAEENKQRYYILNKKDWRKSS